MTKKRKLKATHVEFPTREDQLKFVRFLRLLIKLGIKIEFDAAVVALVKKMVTRDNKIISEMFFNVSIWHD